MGSVAELVGSRSCQAVGIGSLPEWRQLRPQDVDAQPGKKLPREMPATGIVFRDRDVIWRAATSR